jgi:RPA family protein
MFSTEFYGTKVEKDGKFLSPAGRWFRRIMVTGVLTDVVDSKNGLKAYIYDGVGKYVIYISKYNPEALVTIKKLSAPCYVTVVGRPKMVEDKVFVRPEFVAQVTAEEHKLWLAEAIHSTSRALERTEDEAYGEAYGEEDRARVEKAVEVARERLRALAN